MFLSVRKMFRLIIAIFRSLEGYTQFSQSKLISLSWILILYSQEISMNRDNRSRDRNNTSRDWNVVSGERNNVVQICLFLSTLICFTCLLYKLRIYQYFRPEQFPVQLVQVTSNISYNQEPIGLYCVTNPPKKKKKKKRTC